MTQTAARRFVTDNPVIDEVWWEDQMAKVQHKLRGQFPHLDEETIAAALDQATQRLAVPAHIPNYLPVLVGKDARDRLAAAN